jgi:hypothetical protein
MQLLRQHSSTSTQNNSMFNLEQSIAEWRRRMIAGGIKTPMPLEELECHLREDIQNQIRAGATVEQAFGSATERMGDANGLKQEFEKVSKERKRNWLRAGSVVGGTAIAYSAVFLTWILARRAGKIEITGVEFFLVSGSMAATIFFGLVGRRAAKFLPVVANERRQAAVIITGMFLGAFLLRYFWGFLALDNLVKTQIVLLWTMSPILGVAHCFSAWCERCSATRKQMKALNA